MHFLKYEIKIFYYALTKSIIGICILIVLHRESYDGRERWEIKREGVSEERKERERGEINRREEGEGERGKFNLGGPK